MCHGQCQEWITTIPTYWGAGGGGEARSAAVVDHDGPGPAPEIMYFGWWGGEQAPDFTGVGAYSMHPWDVRVPWEMSLNGGLSTLDALGGVVGGIPPYSLIMTGVISDPNGQIHRLAAWDGTTLHPIGPSGPTDTQGQFSRFLLWDSDGPGTTENWLVASGNMTRVGGVAVSNIAVWDGESWSSLAGGLPFTVYAMVVFDFDGDGPEPARLVVTTSDPVNSVKICDGETWMPLGVTTAGAIAVHDPDGEGPSAASIYVNSSCCTAERFRRWNGQEWVSASLGWPSSQQASVAYMTSFDPDGEGARPPQLVAVGEFYNDLLFGPFYTFAVMSESGWTLPINNPYDATVYSPSGWHYGLRRVLPFDPDGPGPRRTELHGMGPVNAFGAPTYLNSVGPSWNGDSIVPMSGLFYGPPVWGFIRFDADGTGPESTRLYAHGSFSFVEGQEAAGLAVWQDGRWHGLGVADGLMRARTASIFDFDGDGPEAPSLIATNVMPGRSVMNRWDGQQWLPVGNIVRTQSSTNEVFGMASFDGDGPGGAPPSLFMAGNFPGMSGLQRLIGDQWVSAGLPRTATYFSVLEIDHDSSGPLPAVLLSLNPAGILRWTGSDWSPYGGTVTVSNTASNGTGYRWNALAWDSDGSGPLPTELVICADTITTQSGVFRGAGAFNGASWRGIAGGTPPGAIRSSWIVDLDGAGPGGDEIVVCGTSATAILRNGSWLPIGIVSLGVAGPSPEVEGPGEGELFIGGEFEPTSQIRARYFARWRLATPLFVAENPVETVIPLNATASLSVEVTGSAPQLRWKRNGQIVNDGLGGASPGGGTVIGATSAVLTIVQARCSDAGGYTCEATNACYSTESDMARLDVLTCPCDADVNCDNVLSPADVAAMERAVGGDLAGFCLLNPDFNGDFALDGFDVEAVEIVVQGGPCP